MIYLPHLETDITSACQLSCVACNHHIALYRAQGRVGFAIPAQVEKDLNELAKFVRVGAWGALGGEPLLHPQLVDILKIVRMSAITSVIEVWTNGLLIKRMGEDFWQAFDHLVVSAYPGKLTDEDLEWIHYKCAHNGIELRVVDERNNPNFRTLFEPNPTNPAQTAWKFATCFFRSFSRVANNGYFYTCCVSAHMPQLVQKRPAGSDGILIEDLTEESLNAFLYRTEPLGCCSICAGRDTAVPIRWHEQRDPDLWLKEGGMS